MISSEEGQQCFLRWKILQVTLLCFSSPVEGYHPPHCALSSGNWHIIPDKKEQICHFCDGVAQLGYTYTMTHWNLKIKWPIRNTGDLNLIHEHENQGQEADKYQRRKTIPTCQMWWEKCLEPRTNKHTLLEKRLLFTLSLYLQQCTVKYVIRICRA